MFSMFCCSLSSLFAGASSISQSFYFSPHFLSGSRTASASIRPLESARVRPLPALDLLRLHQVSSELDHSFRLRHVLSSVSPSRPARIPHLRAAHSGGSRRDVRARRHVVAHRLTPLLLNWLLRSKRPIGR